MMDRKEIFKCILNVLVIITSIKYGTCKAVCPPSEKMAERYVACEANATQLYDLQCHPEVLLGFEDHNSNVSWTFNENPKPWGYNTFQKYNSYDLRSEKTNLNDIGNYTCTVKSSNGTTVRRTLNLCMKASDDFELKPFGGSVSKESRVMPGNNISLWCKAVIGNPRCLNPYNYTILWQKVLNNGTRMSVMPSKDLEITSFPEEEFLMKGYLEFKNVREEHYGTYECVVTNAFGNLTLKVMLEKGVSEDEYFALLYKALIVTIVTVCVFFPIVICFGRRVRNVVALYYREKTFDPSVAGKPQSSTTEIV